MISTQCLLAAVLVACATAALSLHDTPLNFLQLKGTHNSYQRHVSQPYPLLGGSLSPMPNLDTQLSAGLRYIEFDPWLNNATFPVYHVPVEDQLDHGSWCRDVQSCLKQILAWQNRTGNTELIVIKLDVKCIEIICTMRTDWVQEMEAIVRDTLPDNSIVLPADVKPCHWPTWSQLQGKFIVTLAPFPRKTDAMAVEFASKYFASSGDKRLFHLRGSVGWGEDNLLRYAHLVEISNPALPESFQQIAEMSRLGFLVGVFAETLLSTDYCHNDPFCPDSDNSNVTMAWKQAKAAIASGAQLIQTDYPKVCSGSQGYDFHLPNGNASSHEAQSSVTPDTQCTHTPPPVHVRKDRFGNSSPWPMQCTSHVVCVDER